MSYFDSEVIDNYIIENIKEGMGRYAKAKKRFEEREARYRMTPTKEQIENMAKEFVEWGARKHSKSYFGDGFSYIAGYNQAMKDKARADIEEVFPEPEELQIAMSFKKGQVFNIYDHLKRTLLERLK